MKEDLAYKTLNKILNGFTTNHLCSCNHKDGQAIIRANSEDNVALFTCILDGIESNDYQNVGLKNVVVTPDSISGDRQEAPCRIREIVFADDCEQVWEIYNDQLCLFVDIANKMSHNSIHQNAVISWDAIGQTTMTFLASHKTNEMSQDYLADIQVKMLKPDKVTGPRSFNGWVIDVSILKDLLLDFIHPIKIISLATQTYTDDPYPMRITFDLSDKIHCDYLQAPIALRK